MRTLLLLRGVNVGGNSRVPMADLRAQLTAAGLTHVTSYINSGNLLLDARPDAAALVAQVLASHYDFAINHVLIPAAAYQAALAQVPAWWGEGADRRHNALFKLPGYLPAYDQLIAGKLSPYEQVAFTPVAVFWSSPQRTNFSQAFYAKMLPEPFYPQVSIRNRNTTLKLGQLLAEPEP